MRAVTVVVVLVLLAGCNGAPSLDGPGSATTETVSPVDVPADYAYAPGVTDAGVTDPLVLAEAHESVLVNTSFRLTANRTVRYANGTLREHLSVDVAVTADGTYLASAATAGPAAPVFLGRPPANGTYWSNGSVYVRKLTRDGRTTYTRFEPPGNGAGTWQYWTRTVPFGGEQATPGAFYGALFADVPSQVDGQTRTDDGTAYRVSGTSATSSRDADELRDVGNVRLVATIRDDGLVESLSLRYQAVVDGQPVLVERTVRYRAVGSTAVERPSWFEKAVEG